MNVGFSRERECYGFSQFCNFCAGRPQTLGVTWIAYRKLSPKKFQMERPPARLLNWIRHCWKVEKLLMSLTHIPEIGDENL